MQCVEFYLETRFMSSPDRFFRDPSQPINDYFDEGPVVVRVANQFTGAIDTSAIDKFRQGVEIDSLKHWDAGLVKIHSGEPGHVSLRSSYGFSDIWPNDETFIDHYDISPEKYISASLVQTLHNSRQLHVSLPGHSYDSLTLDKFLFDGAISPLNARDRKGFLNTSQQYINGVRGTLMDGNERKPLKNKIRAFQSTGGTIITPAGYNTLYDVDFTTLPADDFTAAGSYTIDGKTWWVKGDLPPNGAEGFPCLNDINTTSADPTNDRTGLRIAYMSGSALAQEAIDWAPSWITNLPHRMMAFDLTQIAGYDPERPVLVQWITDSRNVAMTRDAFPIVGLSDVVLTAAAFDFPEKSLSVTVLKVGSGSNVEDPFFGDISGFSDDLHGENFLGFLNTGDGLIDTASFSEILGIDGVNTAGNEDRVVWGLLSGSSNFSAYERTNGGDPTSISELSTLTNVQGGSVATPFAFMSSAPSFIFGLSRTAAFDEPAAYLYLLQLRISQPGEETITTVAGRDFSNFDYSLYGRAFHDEPKDYYHINSPDDVNSSDRVVTQYRVDTRVGVESVSVIPASYDTGSFATIYEVDMTAQSAIASISTGSFSIDGKQWWLKGPSNATVTASLIAGQGLHLSNVNTTVFSTANFIVPSFYFDFQQIPDYTPTKPVALQFWWTNAIGTYPGNAMAVGGLVSSITASTITGNSSGFSEFDTTVAVVFYDPDLLKATAVYPNSGLTGYNYIDLSGSGVGVSSSYVFTAVYNYNGYQTCSMNFAPKDSTGWTNVNDTFLSSDTRFFARPSSNLTASMGAYFTVEDHLGSPFPPAELTLGGFRVLQPGVVIAAQQVTATQYISSSATAYTDVFSHAYSNIHDGERPVDMVIAVLAMTGSSTDNYVTALYRSMPTGWDYNDNTAVGTDSIAFGGQTH